MTTPWNQKLSRMVPMRDGTRLSCDIRLPEGPGPFPVILWRTPYNKAKDLVDPEVTRWTDKGYGFVAQDCRGRHESEGQFEPMIQDARDGADTIAWIREQDFCNGQVGMTGASYCGWTQLAAASAHPEGLAVILPQVMSTENLNNLKVNGGILGMVTVWWLLVNTNRSQMADPVGDWDRFLSQLPVNQLDEILGFLPIPAFKRALDPESAAELEREHSIVEGVGSSEVPMLIGVGWFDAFAARSMKDASWLMGLRNQKGQDTIRVIAGPWGHGLCESTECAELDFGGESLIDLKGLQEAYVSHCMKGTELPPELEKPVLYFMMGENKWRQADNWPPDETTETVFHLDVGTGANSLDGDGVLSHQPATGSASDSYDYDPLDPVPSIGGASLFLHAPAGPMDQRPAERRQDVLCYTSEPLDQPLRIAGIPRADLFVSSSAVDTDFFVRICDVHPDGRSMLICDGCLRLACRDGVEDPVMAEPGTCYRLSIELASTAISILPGHALRVEVTSSCFPRFVRNLNCAVHPCVANESDAVVARQTLYHTAEQPSRIILPVLAG